MADRVTSLGLEVLRDGTPAARVTSLGLEVLRNGTANARVTSLGMEVLRSLTDAPTTWDPSAVAGIALSGGNLVATANSFNFNGVRATNGKLLASGGKWYWEITTNGLFSDSRSSVGFDDDQHALTSTPNGGHYASLNEPGTAMAAAGFAGITTTLGPFVSKTIGIAVDFTAMLWWATYDGVTWNAGGSANPATGVGGQSFSGASMGGTSGRFFIYGGIIDAGATMTLNTGGSAYARGIPSGFASWDVQAAPTYPTGALTSTEAKDALAATGTVYSYGAFNATETKDAFAASGAGFTTPVGTFNTNEIGDTAAIDGRTPLTGTFNVTGAKDAFVAFGNIPVVVGTFTATEGADKWATTSGFEPLGIENPTSGGSAFRFSTNGPNRIIVVLTTANGSTAVSPVTGIAGSGPVGSTLHFQNEDVVVAGPDLGGAVYRMEIWWAYSQYKIVDENFSVSYGPTGVNTAGSVDVVAVKGLNGNYDNPWEQDNSWSHGSGMGSFFPNTSANVAIKSFTPVSTGPLDTTGGPTGSAVTFDPASANGVTLDGSDLVVTSSGSGSPANWVTLPAVDAKNIGNVYYECQFNVIAGSKYGTGLLQSGTQAGPLGLINTASGGIICRGDGTIWANGSQVASLGGAPANGDWIGVAVSFDYGQVWFRNVTQNGKWNGSATADPVQGFGGFTYSWNLGLGVLHDGSGYFNAGAKAAGGVGLPYAFPDGTSSSAKQTYNFGASAWAGTAPTGWSGWGVGVGSGVGGSTVRMPYPSIVIGFAMSAAGVTDAVTGVPSGYTLMTHDRGGGSQRYLDCTTYAQVCSQNIILSDDDYQQGPVAPFWAMMFDTLTGVANPGYWQSTEATDVAFSRGYVGAFSGYVGDLATSEAADTAIILGFQRDSGIFVSREAPDVFSAYGFQPFTMVLAATEATDRFSAAGVGQGENGVWISTEAIDLFAAQGTTPISGPFVTTEAADRFYATGAGVTQVRRRRTLFVT